MTKTECLQALGLSSGASDADIKSAYRKLANQYHPDKSSGDADKFAKVSEAYRHLKKGTYTPEYHSTGGGRRQYYNNNAGYSDPNDMFRDIFEDMMNNWGGRQGFGGGRAEQKTVITYRVDIETIYSGGSFKTEDGSDIEVPEGVFTNTLLNAGKNYIRFALKNNSKFLRLNDTSPDLVLRTKVSIPALMSGTEFQVKHVNGDTISITIPKGTAPNSKLRVKGRGLPVFDPKDPYKKSKRYGDLYVMLTPYMPKVSKKQAEKLKEIFGKEINVEV